MVRPLSQTLRNPIAPVPSIRDGAPERLHSRVFHFALWTWLVLTIALTVKNANSLYVHTSYPIYEYGAQRWWSDENMYEKGEKDYDFRYGPVFAVGMSPLAALPTPLGSLLFIWGSVGIFYLVLRELIGQLLPGDWTARRQGIYLLLALLTTFRMFWALQINPLVFAAVAGAALAVKHRRWWLASFLLAIAVHIKVWPLAAALLFVACWPRQIGWRFAVALLLVGAMPLLTRPPQMVWQQYQWWFETLFGRAQIRHTYHDAWTVWSLIHSPVPPLGYQAAQLLAAVMALAACVWQKRRGGEVTCLLTFLLGIWLAWQMVFGPATERNTFGMIGSLTAWAIITAWEEPWRRGWMSVSFLLTSVLALGFVERAFMPNVPWILAAHPIGSAMFAIWLVGYARRHWRESPVDAARATA